jgi:hypothetical protein
MTYGNYEEITANPAEILEISEQNTRNLYTKKILQGPLSSNKLSELSECVRNCPNVSVEHGLGFMLGHFEEPLFPRNVSTAATRGAQKPVYDKDRAMLFFQGTLRQDCRLACYPNYEELAKNRAITPHCKPKPSHLFIDLDLTTFAGDRHKLDLALKATLRAISHQMWNSVPTVLWSGGGYHIHQPLDAAILPVYEYLPEFKRYKDPSIQFMRYAERQLTRGKCDRNHCMSFKSAMARIPGSRNSKYAGEIANVRVVQAWNGVRARPTQQFMLSDFLIWLVQAEVDANKERLRLQAYKFDTTRAAATAFTGGIGWIDRLLQTPIADWRKTAVALILAPYLLTIKRMSYEHAYNTIMHWAAACSQLSSLQPSSSGFINRVHMSLARAQEKGQRPMRWATLVQNYSAMYEAFKVGGAVQ